MAYGAGDRGSTAPRKRAVTTRQHEVKDTKSAADLSRAHEYAKSKPYRQALRDTYDQAPPKQKARILHTARSVPSHPISKIILHHAATLGHEAKDTKGNADRARGGSVPAPATGAVRLPGMVGRGRMTPVQALAQDVRTGVNKDPTVLRNLLAQHVLQYKGGSKVLGITNPLDSRHLVEGSADPVGQQVAKFNEQAMSQRVSREQGGSAASAMASPAVFALHQAVRPSHFITTALHTGSLRKAGQAFLHSDKAATGYDVAGDLGIHNKALRAGVGFVVETATDPTVLGSLAMNIPAKLLAARAGEEAAAKVAKATEHLAPHESLAAQSAAYKRAHDAAYAAAPGKARGVTLGARLHVPLTQKTRTLSTPAIGSRFAAGARVKAGARVENSKVGSKARDILRSINPDIRPSGVDQASHNVIRSAGRKARGVGARDLAKSMDVGSGLSEVVPEGASRSFAHGIETAGPMTKEQSYFHDLMNKRHSELESRGLIEGSRNRGPQPTVPQRKINVEAARKRAARTAAVAKRTGLARDGHEARRAAAAYEKAKVLGREESNVIRKATKANKAWNSTAARYYPHVPLSDLYRKTGLGDISDKPALDASQKTRSILEPMHMQARAGEPLEVHPGPLATHYLSNTGGQIARSDFHAAVRGLGRQLKGEMQIGKDETIFKVGKDGLTPIKINGGRTSAKKLRDALKAADQPFEEGEKFVILPSNLHDHWAAQLARTAPAEHSLVRGYDKTLGKIKQFQTVGNPAYQGTNLAGDAFMGRQGRATTLDFEAAKTLTRVGNALNKHVRSGDAAHGERFTSNAYVKVKGKRVKATELIRRFEAQGLGEGGHNRDLNSLIGKPSSGGFRRFNTARETLPRYASFVSALRRGMNDEQAAAHVVQHHFDYSDLTEAERGLRRIVPFYTFAARNTKLQAKMLAKSPGRLATYEKAREETGRARGMSMKQFGAWEKSLPDYAARGAPFPLPGGLRMYPRMPLTDINQFSVSPKEITKNVTDRMSPLIKMPLEAATGRNFYFNEPINPNDPKDNRVMAGAKGSVAAPNMLGIGKLLEKAGIAHPIMSSHKGQGMIPGWNPYIPWGLRTLPQGNYPQQFLTNSGDANHGVTSALAVVNLIAGVKVAKEQTPKEAYGRAIQLSNELQAQENDARLRGDTKKEEQVKAKLKIIGKQMPVLRDAAGYTVKARKRKAGGAIQFNGGSGQKIPFSSGSGGKIAFK